MAASKGISRRARGDIIESGEAQLVTYDLQDDDELWGLGVGCDGVMRVHMQPLDAGTHYEPFASIAAALINNESFEFRTDTSEGEFSATLPPPPRVLVLGAGLDAEPVVRMAVELGWQCTVVDHRESYVEGGDFAAAESVHCLPPGELDETLELDGYSAAIVMSHHLASDREYLRQVAASSIEYVGLLGPPGRRDRLLEELGTAGEALDGRLHAPIGLDLGGRGPAAIALSIVAEIQSILDRR